MGPKIGLSAAGNCVGGFSQTLAAILSLLSAFSLSAACSLSADLGGQKSDFLAAGKLRRRPFLADGDLLVVGGLWRLLAAALLLTSLATFSLLLLLFTLVAALSRVGETVFFTLVRQRKVIQLSFLGRL